MTQALEELSVRRFARDGYLVVPQLAGPELRERMLDRINAALDPLEAPAEFEADVGYPGSPESRDAEGGYTVRRLLNAFSRDPVFKEWAAGPEVASYLRGLMGEANVSLSQCHHNCVMTKHPGYSSKTMWHQDIRYWSYDRPELVSVWLALGQERDENGALWVIPGTHESRLDRGRLDRDLFLRPELPENQEMIERAEVVRLEPGDVLFFHCRLFHAAGMNCTDKVKFSAVFTYHADSNQPIPGTRSSLYPPVPLTTPA